MPESSCGISATVKEAMDVGGFEAGEWLKQKWWEEFDDPVLTSLIDQGLQSSPNLKIAQERLKAAAQVALQKKSSTLP